MKTYCPECGKPTEYIDVKPNFCASCASPLSVSANASAVSHRPAPIAPRRPSYRRPIDDDYDDRSGVQAELPDIRKLDVEIEIPEYVPTKASEVWGSDPRPDAQRDDTVKRGRGRPPKGSVVIKSTAPARPARSLEDFTQSIFKTKIIDMSPNGKDD